MEQKEETIREAQETGHEAEVVRFNNGKAAYCWLRLLTVVTLRNRHEEPFGAFAVINGSLQMEEIARISC